MVRKVSYLILFFIAWQLIGLVSAKGTDQLFDEYGKVSWKVEKIHLNEFENFLLRHPDMTGYIVFTWTTSDGRVEMKRRVERAKDYLIKRKKVETSRLIIMDSGKQARSRTILQPVRKELPPPDFSEKQ